MSLPQIKSLTIQPVSSRHGKQYQLFELHTCGKKVVDIIEIGKPDSLPVVQDYFRAASIQMWKEVANAKI